MSCDIQELEASLKQQDVVREQETPAEEIARLKGASQADHFNVDREVRLLAVVFVTDRAEMIIGNVDSQRIKCSSSVKY